eukprot:980244-Pyramimonas_sp.AAC.1
MAERIAQQCGSPSFSSPFTASTTSTANNHMEEPALEMGAPTRTLTMAKKLRAQYSMNLL